MGDPCPARFLLGLCSLSVTSDEPATGEARGLGLQLVNSVLSAGFRPGSSVATTSPERSRTSAAARRTHRRLGVFDLLLSVMLVAHAISVPRGRVNCHHPLGLITRVIQLGAKCFGPSVAFAVESSVSLPTRQERVGAGDEGEPSGTDDGLLPAADPELGVDVAGMRFDRVERYVQLVADLP
jgi:hypothetical protein